MRLSLKIAVLIGLGATLLVLVISLLSMRRDVQIVEEDIARDSRLVAASLAVAAHQLTQDQTWELVEQVAEQSEGITVRYLPEGSDSPEILMGPEAITATVNIEGGGSIQVTESLAPRQRLVSGSIRSLLATTAFVMLLSLGAGMWLGRSLVGRRVDSLVDKARRVARGEFDEPVAVAGADELTVLATELNLMAGQLKSARERSASDAKARLEAEVQLRHADRLRTVGQLSAGIAHELGTPLNVIAGRASLLLRVLPEGPDHANALTIRAQTQRIVQIVRRLMDYSRRSPMQREVLQLDPLVREIAKLLRPTLSEKDIELEVISAQPIVVSVDVEQLRQVVTNLVQNAAQAVDSGGRIELTLIQARDTVELIVDDNGTGIPEDLRERVLEPFYTSKEPGEGTGLGLSVVDGIVKEHGGTLFVGESPMGGARFRVVLPRTAREGR